MSLDNQLLSRFTSNDFWLTLTFYGKVKYDKMLVHEILWKVLKILT